MTREEIINEIKPILEELNYPDAVSYLTQNDVMWLNEDIKALEQEPKAGHWIVQPSNEEQGERPFIWWKCSNCGHVIFSESTHDRLEFHAFCGRCGANMVESQNRVQMD